MSSQQTQPIESSNPFAELRSTNSRALRLLESLAPSAPVYGARFEQLVLEFRKTHRRLAELLDSLEVHLQDGGNPAHTARAKQLEQRLENLESENQDLSSRVVSLENRGGQMMKMFVATYQLYAAQDASEVQATIGEIAVDLLGAESFVLLWREDDSVDCRVALTRGLESQKTGPYSEELYRGGDPLVDATLEDGVLRFQPDATDEPLAVVPMRVQNVIAGVLVIFKLFDHRPALSADDREILDLLAAHAASALFAAKAYALTARKLHSLESLVRLLQGGS